MFHIIDGQWNGQAASDMYRSKLAPAMRKEYPSKRRFLLLEDNDPSGTSQQPGKRPRLLCVWMCLRFHAPLQI